MILQTSKGMILELPCPKCDKGLIRGYLGDKARCGLCGYGLRLGKQRKRPFYVVIPRQVGSKRTNSIPP